MPVNYSFPVHNWCIPVHVPYVISSHLVGVSFFILDYQYLCYLPLVCFASVEPNLGDNSLARIQWCKTTMAGKIWTCSFCLDWSKCSLNEMDLSVSVPVFTGLCWVSSRLPITFPLRTKGSWNWYGRCFLLWH